VQSEYGWRLIVLRFKVRSYKDGPSGRRDCGALAPRSKAFTTDSQDEFALKVVPILRNANHPIPLVRMALLSTRGIRHSRNGCRAYKTDPSGGES